MPMLGGWEYPKEVQAVQLPDKVATAFDQAMRGFVGAQYTPVLFVGQQIVNGTNYCIVCHVKTVTREPIYGFKAVYINVSSSGDSSHIIKIDNVVS